MLHCLLEKYKCFPQQLRIFCSNLKFLFDTTIVGSLSGSKDQCFDPMFILTSDREIDENPNFTSRTMTLPIERRQSGLYWSKYLLQHDTTRYYTILCEAILYHTILYYILYYLYNIPIAMDVSDINCRILFFLQGIMFL